MTQLSKANNHLYCLQEVCIFFFHLYLHLISVFVFVVELISKLIYIKKIKMLYILREIIGVNNLLIYIISLKIYIILFYFYKI
jgi:hypothetical protein